MMNIEKRIDEILGKLSLHEKIGQLNQPETPTAEYADAFKEKVRRGEIGSVLMSVGATAGNDPQGAIDVSFYNELQRIAVEESPGGIPILFGRDVIHGHRTVLPIPLAMAASFNGELVEACYRDTAREAANESVHWSFAPMLDLARDPRWGRVIEGPGEDPLVGASVARAVVRGFQGEDPAEEGRLLACAKHYIGYGAAEGGRDYHRTEISDYSLYNYYLPAFRAAVDAGAMTVMSSFNDINGEPVTASRRLLTDVLRGKLGFSGFVVSDYGCVEQLIRQGVCADRTEASAMALEAGLDMDMWDGCYLDHLEEAVACGRIDEAVIDEAVRRVLRVKLRKGLFDSPYCRPTEIDRVPHLARARQLAAESMVLLKNENDLLPLPRSVNIALIGPFAHERRSLLGSWTIDGRAEETPSLAEAMRAAVAGQGKVRIAEGVGFEMNLSGKYAEDADVVVMALGESWAVTGENKALSTISLPEDQLALIRKIRAIGKKVVGVLFCGRPVAMQEISESFDAILYAWHAGSEAANAVCDILFGDRSPSGRLPITLPRLATHIPLYYNITSSGRPVNCYYGENSANCYVDSSPTPAFPFGYGLTYTDFTYGEIACAKAELPLCEIEDGACFRLSVSLCNTGHRSAAEVVQLYIHDPVAAMMRPLRELKAYRKTALAPGEQTDVVFTLGKEELGYYLPDGRFTLERGEIEVFIGENCLCGKKISLRIV